MPLHSKKHIHFTLNGEQTEVAFAPHKTLLEVLREDLNLTGTKHGCELGECGTCAVLVDGRSILSCLMLGLDAEGRDVKTIEGMAHGPELAVNRREYAARQSLAGARPARFDRGRRLRRRAQQQRHAQQAPRRDRHERTGGRRHTRSTNGRGGVSLTRLLHRGESEGRACKQQGKYKRHEGRRCSRAHP